MHSANCVWKCTVIFCWILNTGPHSYIWSPNTTVRPRGGPYVRPRGEGASLRPRRRASERPTTGVRSVVISGHTHVTHCSHCSHCGHFLVWPGPRGGPLASNSLAPALASWLFSDSVYIQRCAKTVHDACLILTTFDDASERIQLWCRQNLRQLTNHRLLLPYVLVNDLGVDDLGLFTARTTASSPQSPVQQPATRSKRFHHLLGQCATSRRSRSLRWQLNLQRTIAKCC